MKKVLSYILISLVILVNLFAPFSAGIKNESIEINKNEAEAADCVFDKITVTPELVKEPLVSRPDKISLNIETSNCTGKFFKGYLRKGGILGGEETGLPVLNILPREITSDNFSFNIKPGEYYCGGDWCSIALQLFLLQKGTAGDTEIDKYVSGDDIGPKEEIKYSCTNNKCDDAILFSLIESSGTNESVSFSMIPSVTSGTVTVKGLGPVMIANANGGTSISANDTVTIEIFDDKQVSVPGLNNNPIKYNVLTDLTKDLAISYSTTFSGLKPATAYSVKLTANFVNIPSLNNKIYKLDDIYTLDEAGQTVKPLPPSIDSRGTAQNSASSGPGPKMPACSMNPLSLGSGTFMGCIAQAFYYVLFVPTSYLFALAGTFFDNTFSYSVQDSSYRSAFVVSGWGLVRDFCNMFFIFILLYTAIATTLSLHGFKTKETIINVVIIGLFINFSLFATQIIIDASNITARVFYNADSIKITENGANGVASLTPGLKEGDGGVIPLSAALVNKINPQNLIMNSDKINNIPVKGGDSAVQDESKKDLGIGTFILIVIMASAVNIVGFVVFLSVGLIFIARVIGLWMAMIIAPLAFFTYILPEMSSAKMIGWKNWWPETLKLAFLAPVFIFFMYIILKFLESDSIIPSQGEGNGLAFFISILMPFAFIMILLMKAKKIATDMSGEMGAMAAKAGAVAGGLALGAATGGAAFAMRGTVGRIGARIASSGSLAEAEAKGGIKGTFARMALKSGAKIGAGSFDARNTKLGGMAGSGLGVDLGKGKTGGFVKDKADKLATRTKRADELKKIANTKNDATVRKTKADKQLLENENSKEIHHITSDMDEKKEIMKDTLPGSDDYNKAEQELKDLKKKLKAVKSGNIKPGETNTDGTNKYNTTNGHITETEHDNALKQAETDRKNASEATDKINGVTLSAGADKAAAEKEATDNEVAAITKADADEKAALDKADNDFSAATTKAASDKVAAIDKAASDEKAAIEDAIKSEAEAKSLSSKANQALLGEPLNTSLANAANNAKIAADQASQNVIKVTAESKAATSRATINAENEHATATNNAANNHSIATTKAKDDSVMAKTTATTTKDAAFIAAADAEKAAIKKAEDESKSAIDKATKSQEAATSARNDAKNGFGQSISELNKQKEKQEQTIKDKENEVLKNYANYIDSGWNKAANIFSGGNTRGGYAEAADTMRQGIVVKGAEDHGGGGHTAHAAAPKHEEKHEAKKEDKPHDEHGGGGH